MNGMYIPEISALSENEDCRGRAKELERILGEGVLHAVYQPIISVREQRIFGYEALIRGPENSPLCSPAELFITAGIENRLDQLDLICRETCIKGAAAQRIAGHLFINILPQFITDKDFPHGDLLIWAKESGLDPHNIVLEITEQHPVSSYDDMRRAIHLYRSMGFKIALDDLGAGYAGLRQWSELRPDYVKIDRHFVDNVHIDAVKRQFIHSICEISHILGCEVIAEGIEQEEEYEVVRSLGAHYAQGFFFAQPKADPMRALDPVKMHQLHQQYSCRHCTQDVGTLVRKHIAVSPDTTVHKVAELFQKEQNMRFLPIVEQNRPVGMVRRHDFMNMYSSRYGRDLHGRKPINLFMFTEPVVVSCDTLIEQLSQRLTANSSTFGEDDYIVTNEMGDYLGTGTLVDLLRVITELQIRNARYSNPLTQLPGNVPISEHMDDLLSRGEWFAVVYVDLDYFKPFNDTYGYARGDDAIRGLARILIEHTNPSLDFVGHIGGDDFIMLLLSKDWQERCEAILHKFGQFANHLYDPQHLSEGGISSLDRQGRPMFFPLLSVSLAVTLANSHHYFSHNEISAEASAIKAQAKRMEGNSLFVDRRTQE